MFAFFEKLLQPFPDARHGAPPKGLIQFSWHFVRDAKWFLVASACLSALIAIGEVALFRYLGELVDWLGAADTSTFLADHRGALIAMALVLAIGLPLANFLFSLITHQTLLGNLPMSARWRMHRRMLGQSMNFYADEFAGRVATKVMQTSLAVREAVMKLIEVFVYVSIYFLTTIATVAAADWRLAAPMVAWLAAYLCFVRYFVPRLSSISEKQADARSAMTGRIVDSYTNIATVKLFAHAGREEAYARAGMKAFLDTVHPQMRLVTRFHSLVYLNNCLGILLVAALSIHLWSNALISVGAIATAIGLALRLNGMSQWVMWEVSALFENVGVIYDGMEILTRAQAVTDREGATKMARPVGAISFEDVSFHYGKDGGVIEGLNLSVSAGEKIGIVGRSGAGKSTLVNLLLRLYDLERGRIAIDGLDISKVTQDSLRSHIGVVTQDTALLHRSIRDNIAYGRPDASDEEIIDAARRANAYDFIRDLADRDGRTGLDAHVGERGVRLSGGQRQRIAIARVFLKDAPILVLDEATSALDSEVEQAIQENLFELMRGKTVIAIAHRLSTIAALDRLIVLDKGAVIEEGRHDHLVAAGGVYADLWKRQSGGFLSAAADESARGQSAAE
ncbi:MAG: ATP-binding cassette domain-containing protein [Alphaproteobacteria bacterium]|nr:ATP-binding cassette domain-containing protein [Alphaproteobacteria bacterium]